MPSPQCETVDVLMLHRSIRSMDLQRRLKQSLAVHRPVRRGRQELGSMLVLVAVLSRRLVLLQRNHRAHPNNVQMVCVVVIGCRKFQSLSGNFSLHLFPAKGDNSHFAFTN